MTKTLTKETILYAGLLFVAIAYIYGTTMNILSTIACAICVLIYFILSKEKKWHIKSKLLYGFMLLYLLRIIGICWALDPADGKVLIESNFSLLLFPLLFAMFDLKREMADAILVWFVRSILLFTVISLGCLVYYSSVLNISLLEWITQAKGLYSYILNWSNFGAMVHPSYIALVTAFAAAASIYLCFDKTAKHKTSLIETIVSVILFSILIIYTGCRIVTLLLPLIFLLAAFIYLPFRRRINGILVLTSLILFFTCITAISKNQKFFKDPIRVQLYQMTLDAIKERPLFGYGTGSQKVIVEELPRAQKLGYDSIYPDVGHSHNQFLAEFLQYGVILGLVLPVLMLCILILAWKQKNFLLLSFWLIEIGFMLVEGPFDTQKGITFFSFFATFLIMCQNNRNPKLLQE
ncbi:MAG: O-antigen ligase family protein [Prevotellaceae bacterium]|jgi:O-antigen ligase|nr:O-antigen ligase family protein [Prevotellaceae bacterium]